MFKYQDKLGVGKEIYEIPGWFISEGTISKQVETLHESEALICVLMDHLLHSIFLGKKSPVSIFLNVSVICISVDI